MRTSTRTNNHIVREAMNNAQMYQWELAELIGVSEPTLIRWMRREMPIERQEELVELIRRSKA